MSASDFFGSYFPVLFFLVCLVLVGAALQTVVNVIYVLASIPPHHTQEEIARLANTGTATSGAPMPEEKSGGTSRSRAPVTQHGDLRMGQDAAADETIPPRSGCFLCRQARAAFFRLRAAARRN